MTKKLLCFAIVLLLVVSFALPVAAQGNTLAYITDTVGLLTEEERADLESRAASVAQQYESSIYIVLLNDYHDYGSTPEEASYNIWSYNEVGKGAGKECLFLLLSMSERDYWMDDFGDYTEWAISDSGMLMLEDVLLDDLANNEWYDGLADFLSQGETLLRAAANSGETPSTTHEFEYRPSFWELAPKYFGIAFVVGLVAAFITCSIFKAQMKTAVKATSAEHYVTPGGVNFHVRQDRYTHTTRIERKIERNTSSGGGGFSSGGSVNNSGRGGKF